MHLYSNGVSTSLKDILLAPQATSLILWFSTGRGATTSHKEIVSDYPP